MLTFDYHSHHRRCGHAVGEMDHYAQAAVDAGLTHFGVSDHGPAYWRDGDHAQPGTQMAVSEFGAYVADARRVRRAFADRLDVAVGVEADWIDGREDDLRALLDSQELDYVLGSVHYSLGRSIFLKDWERVDVEAVFRDYYRQVADAARSGLFDILSHLTAVEAYAPLPDPDLADALYVPVADAVAASGCVVEVNTSGYRKRPAIDEPFPNRRMLRLLIERGVPITFGSDCHRPDEVSYAADRVAALLDALGVDRAAGPVPVRVRRGPVLAYRTDIP